MAVNYSQRTVPITSDRKGIVAVAVMAIAVLVAVVLIGALGGAFESFPFLFLLPWVFGTGVVIAAPSIYLYYRGEFSFTNPIVFASASYFAPAFVLGGIFLATGYSDPYYLSYIQDAEYDLPLTMVLIALGFASMAIGYFVPLGSIAGNFMGRLLPNADFRPSAFILPGILLLILGVLNTIFAFAMGLFGYQISAESNTYAGLIYLSTLLRVEASFLLWLIIFRLPRFTAISGIIIAILAVVDLSSALCAGNRGTLLQVFIVIFIAYIFSGRRFTMKHGVIGASVLTLGITIGMVYGTTFRQVKGTEATQSSGQYAENILKTFDEVGRSNTYDSISMGLTTLSERLDIVSTLAVVVSNYEKLAPYEEAYGLDNNIWIDTSTFLIPRIIWTEKPAASDARKYSDLYFNTAESSFAITPIGDLLRNFGIIGIPIGMFILGVILRFIHSALIGDGNAPIWKVTIYFMLLTAVSYEGFYGTIVPTVVKVGFTATIGILVVGLIARKMDTRQSNTAI